MKVRFSVQLFAPSLAAATTEVERRINAYRESHRGGRFAKSLEVDTMSTKLTKDATMRVSAVVSADYIEHGPACEAVTKALKRSDDSGTGDPFGVLVVELESFVK